MAISPEDLELLESFAAASKSAAPATSPSEDDELLNSFSANFTKAGQAAVGGDENTDLSDPGLTKNVIRAVTRDLIALGSAPSDAGLWTAEQSLKANRFVAQAAGIDTPFSLDYAIDLLDRASLSKSTTEGANALGVRTDPQFDEDTPPFEKLVANIAGPTIASITPVGAAKTLATNVPKFTGMAANALRTKFPQLLKGEVAAGVGGGSFRTAAEGAGAPEEFAMSAEIIGNLLFGGVTDRITAGKAALKDFKESGLGELGVEFHRNVSESLERFNKNQFRQAQKVVQKSVTSAGGDLGEITNRAQSALANDAGRVGSEAVPSDIEQFSSLGARFEIPEVISLENSLISKFPGAKEAYNASKSSMREFMGAQLKRLLGSDNIPDEMVKEVFASSEYRINLLEINAQLALDEAKALFAKLPPGSNYAEQVKTLLSDLATKARGIEKKMWADAGIAGVDARPLHEFLLTQIKNASKTHKEFGGVPSKKVQKFIEALATPGINGSPTTTTTEEILDMRTMLYEKAEKAGAAGKNVLAKRYRDLAKEALRVLETSDASNLDALTEARKFSLHMNDRFYRDVIGRYLARSAKGGELVPGNQLLEDLIKPRQAGATNIKELKFATGRTVDGEWVPELPEAAEAGILRHFTDEVMSTGEINPELAENYLKNYGPMLTEAGLVQRIEELAKVGRQVADTKAAHLAMTSPAAQTSAAKMLTRYGETGDGLVVGLTKKFQSEGSGAGAELQQLFAEIDQFQGPHALVRGVSPEERAAARGGLKSAIAQAAWQSIYTAEGESTRIPAIARNIRDALVSTGEYTDAQIEGVTTMMDAAARSVKARRKVAVPGQSKTVEALASVQGLEELMRLAGLKLVAPRISGGTGSGSIHIAGRVSSIFGRMGRELAVTDASELLALAPFNQQLMLDLLQPIDSTTPAARGRIRSWLSMIANPAIKYGTLGGNPIRGSTVVPATREDQEDGR